MLELARAVTATEDAGEVTLSEIKLNELKLARAVTATEEAGEVAPLTSIGLLRTSSHELATYLNRTTQERRRHLVE